MNNTCIPVEILEKRGGAAKLAIFALSEQLENTSVEN